MPENGSRKGAAMGAEGATALAIEALSFLAGDADRLPRFLAVTGLEAHELRAAAADPSFFVAVLDFVLADEKTVLAFAATSAIAPERVAQARRALAGPETDFS